MIDSIRKIKAVLFSPKEFFTKLKPTISDAFMFLAIITIPAVILSTFSYAALDAFMSAISQEYAKESIFAMFNIPWYILAVAMAVASYFWGLLFSFVGAAMWYVWLLLFGSRMTYTQVYNWTIYMATPAYIISWIPLIGFIGSFWSIYVAVVGLGKLAKFSIMRSIMAIFVVPMILIIIAAVLLLVGIIMLVGMASTAFF